MNHRKKEAAMGTLVIRIPEDINAECEISDFKMTEKLLNMLKLSEYSDKIADHIAKEHEWRALKGKYKGRLSSVDEFIRRKKEEKNLEL